MCRSDLTYIYSRDTPHPPIDYHADNPGTAEPPHESYHHWSVALDYVSTPPDSHSPVRPEGNVPRPLHLHLCQENPQKMGKGDEGTLNGIRYRVYRHCYMSSNNRLLHLVFVHECIYIINIYFSIFSHDCI